MVERVFNEEARRVRRTDWMAVLPAACAVHCTLTPLVAGLLPVVAAGHAFEWVFLVVAAALAAVSLGTSWRTHRTRPVLALAGAGAGVWVASLLGLFEPLPEPVFSSLGGLILAGALLWNGRLRHEAACDSCGCGMHD